MSVPVPLGVRIINNWGRAFDAWVTNLVDDLSFRSVIPGGFANATITLHNDQESTWTQLAQAFNRVQIVDLRSQEIAWEGRIDTVRRNTSDDTWELGCLGSMAYASDIQRPVFYIDGLVSNWVVALGSIANLFSSTTVNEDTQEIQYRFVSGPSISGSHIAPVVLWQKAESVDQFIGRFDITYSGGAPSVAFRTGVDVQTGAGASTETNVHLTAWQAATIRKAAVIGTHFTTTSGEIVRAALDVATGGGTGDSQTFGIISMPRIQAQRVDESGNKLQTGASYPNEYVTVEQVVRDVVGRFMVGAWHTGGNNTPYSGHVGPENIYIDTSATAQITHLTYYDGATAAEILGDLMTAQPGAYWALWESRYGATNLPTEGRFRFEWAVWPTSYAYQATSIDGLEEQPDGGQLANLVFFQYSPNDRTPAGQGLIQAYWDTGRENPLLTGGQTVRAVTVKADEPMSVSTAFDRAQAYFNANQRTINTGTLTVRRPIQAYDQGLNSNSGVARMLDPWLIRPGRLIRITDIPPRSNAHTFAAGDGGVLDGFGRSVSNGWGTSDTGQAWTTDGGSASEYSVSGGSGLISMATVNTPRAVTVPAPGADVDVSATIATNSTPVGGSHFLYVLGRWADASNGYLVRTEFTTASAINFSIRKRVGGTETALATSNAVAGLTHAANRLFAVRLNIQGSTLKAKIWLASAAEPTDWTVTATDTDLTAAGSVGHRAILGGGTSFPTASYDNFVATSQVSYAPELDGTIFRVVGTTYSSSDNSCVLELDQPPAWDTATQVLESGSGSSNLVVRG